MYLYWNSQYEKPSAGKVRSKYRLQIYYLSYIQDFCIPHLDKIVFLPYFVLLYQFDKPSKKSIIC